MEGGSTLSVDYDNGLVIGLAASEGLSGSGYNVGDLISAGNLSEIDQPLWELSDIPDPQGVAVDSMDNVYFIYYNPVGTINLRKLDPGGTELWAKTDVGYPKDIAIDSQDNVYVACYTAEGSPNIWKFDSQGNLLWTSIEIGLAIGITVNSYDQVYVVYNQLMGVKNVRKLYANGVEVWGSSIADYPRAVAVDSTGNAYVAYYGSVSALSTAKLTSYDGSVVWTSIEGIYAHGIAVDGRGDVYVLCNLLNSQGPPAVNFIKMSGYNGQTLWTKWHTGYPFDICFDSKHDVYVAFMSEVTGIQKISSSGTNLWGVTRYRCKGIAMDSLENIYFAGETLETEYLTASSSNYTVPRVGKIVQPICEAVQVWKEVTTYRPNYIIFDSLDNMYVAFNAPLGQVSLRKSDPFGNVIWENSSAAYAIEIALSPDESSIYVTYHGFHDDVALQRITPDGNVVWSKTGLQMESDHSLRGSCHRIVVDKNGYLYVGVSGGVDGAQQINKLDSLGNIIWKHVVRLYCTLMSLVIDSHGDMYYSWVDELEIDSGVVKLSPNAEVLWSNIEVKGATIHLAIDSKDNLYSHHANTSKNINLRKLSPTGEQLQVLRLPWSGGGIELDSRDNIYVFPPANPGTYTLRTESYLHRLSPADKIRCSLFSTSRVTPTSVAFDSHDDAYVSYLTSPPYIQKLRTRTRYIITG